ncbi:hypothetical protein WALSEDRAFT_64638 [Wallemia mellicola CBS 633.66]|uniref:F-box domain-containing protein n=1 Tax=Wallemia mellicola (strain ATCC MYA-4683 / CBS 633.66) TaxID=671144 RepID=I4YBN4_WALMC|nr:hypothetical protein WALSEDRAFT_64638 [Wallemia mellicola CBS 633.66]EIM21376.1 hypothetical protein WALSEDRAFT_64638 [Wallemia mellicola CBS 633.66]|eukprot:XP_006958722.1 hypothetical protein WALSEDRAFT_64638 [Wallemia mellicola CBS 633.66]
MHNLPYELVAIIFDELPRYDVKSLSLVSKYLNTVANTRLYRTISVPKPFFFSSMDPIMLQSSKLIENTCKTEQQLRLSNQLVLHLSNEKLAKHQSRFERHIGQE